jgi:hypothetical protein
MWPKWIRLLEKLRDFKKFRAFDRFQRPGGALFIGTLLCRTFVRHWGVQLAWGGLAAHGQRNSTIF